MRAVLWLTAALLLVWGGATAAAQVCDTAHGTWLKAASPTATVSIVEYVFDETTSEYTPVKSFTHQMRYDPRFGRVKVSVTPQDKKTRSMCLNTLERTDPCIPSSCYINPDFWAPTCVTLYRTGMFRVNYLTKGTSSNDKCNFDAYTNTWAADKLGGGSKDLVNISMTVDREVTKCGEPARRYVKTTWLVYQVTDGCLLNAKAQGCTLGPAGANPCKPCGPGQVRGWLDNNNNNLGCIDKALKCDLEQTGFSGCPAGYEVGGVNGSAVQCLPCKPHTYNNDNAADVLGFTGRCKPCPDYQEAPNWASQGCRGCALPGTVPTRKRAPLACKACPAGTYAQSGEIKCTKCPGGFYTSKPGATKCVKCPTEWRCMVPAKVLGKFGATPYRWDESGNPACASLDGKTCWKAAPDTCAAKLKALPGLIAGGKLKALVCGDMHKKIWGNTGYEEYEGWCSITQRLLTVPGKPGVGATSCSANATLVGTLPAELLGGTTDSGEICKCPACGE